MVPQEQKLWDYNRKQPPGEESMLRPASTLGSRRRSQDSGGAEGNGKCSKGSGGGRMLRVIIDDVTGCSQNKYHEN